jgi:hypothetical protein
MMRGGYIDLLYDAMHGMDDIEYCAISLGLAEAVENVSLLGQTPTFR